MLAYTASQLTRQLSGFVAAGGRIVGASERPAKPRQGGNASPSTTLPGGPRGLSCEVAARYCGISERLFRREVPVAPRRIGSRLVWDKLALDEWLGAGGKAEAPRPRLAERVANWGRK